VLDSEQIALADVRSTTKIGRPILHGCFDRLSREGVDLAAYTIFDVCDDIEAARKALGYAKIKLWAHSWGTTVAYVYALRYPQSVNRVLLLGGSSPARVAVWDPGMLDKLLAYYARLWRNDATARARAPDLLATIRAVLKALPRAKMQISARKSLLSHANAVLVPQGSRKRMFLTVAASQLADKSIDQPGRTGCAVQGAMKKGRQSGLPASPFSSFEESD
jgi:pimeloyl-ACP methyl ester carboxylesterase